MQSTGKTQLLLVLCVLALGRGGPGAAEELSAEPRAPLGQPLAGLLAGLRIAASGQTPADTSLLRPGPRRAGALALLGLKASGQTPADTSLLPRRAGLAPASVGLLGAGGDRQRAGARRQETSSFKQVNGESVRVVAGSYGYDSPEGLPVSFRYVSDENGNQASFSIGGPSSSGPAGSAAAAGPAAGARGTAAGAAKTTGATGGDGDRKYLPPK